ncbi:MAG: pyruvate kinase [Sulfurimonas sp. RIFOXYD12_FULL_33_39]|uniref:pyruvate kinase n=1 Tax=unclassified Sulfurimonas TaxID=2623549 RepID=UPI0008C2E633|nr:MULTISPECIES: pyruvate kinase [unclassified Sulfurimonas]OHE07425.1 MAG: pyruvate kinase [Sulfurimonas sp. RIFCSPLOWO2_12_FULL_34_6]OHE09223.1 MAG: pyruvate kinase [Sulfurimonas sp. RIFOXYD12_FULL_33_39]OHE12994.1 MAG: pyruvate kinase [Sulfurimonas sp. RIFOXYD2_FULL_34_21]DAB28426.1 MAG TPA: pyruvate kinase [Sulfurimonas sp. UBA10385]
MKKRTKILATIGPASDSLEVIESLMGAGANVFRLNFSHGTYEYHLDVINKIRQAMKNMGLVVGILQDISGPKIRVGELEHHFELKEGDTVVFHKDNIMGRAVSEDRYEVSINYPEILSQLHVGDYIYLYDGIIRTKVTTCKDDRVEVSVENYGTLSSKKGVNFPNTFLGVDVLSEKDIADMEWGVKNGVDFMAISFVQDASDMLKARGIVTSLGGKQMLIAKIEKFDAIHNIDAILAASDGLMVARGDLGIEVAYYEVPNIQKMLIHKANMASKPVITATQMLLSMTHSQRATRAEISDIANAVLDGTDAVMLSEESAVGKYPVLAVKAMFETIRETELQYDYFQFDDIKCYDATNAIDESAVRLARDLNVDGILSVTSSGNSARKLAKYRPKQPIYAITHDDGVRQQLTLSWGVIPAFWVKKSSFGQTVREVMQRGFKDGVLHSKSSYILTAGDPVGVSGSTNTIRLLREVEMEFFHKL